MTNPPTFHDALKAHPVMSVLFGPERLHEVLQADAQAVTVSSMELRHLEKLVEVLHEYGKVCIVSIDAIGGLAHDRGGLGYLESIGIEGVVTTRGSLVARIRSAGMVSIQKVFITDRTNLQRMQGSVQQSSPDYVEIMPQPVVDMLTPQELEPFGNLIVAGFISDKADVKRALDKGAAGVSSSDVRLWYKDALK